ncbi:MAG: ATP-binding protein [candidate division KSB1 bacterium]|jgi:two-component system NtrC family sensor kinase|nr:ATP-binding protein [candidate division KSB1 bacterium]
MHKIFELYKKVSFKLFVLILTFLILVLGIITYVNNFYFAKRMEGCIRTQAVQASDLIKQATRISMLRNQRDELSSVMTDLSNVKYIEGIRIYNKVGRIEFSSDSTELHHVIPDNDQRCIYCHDSERAKGTIAVDDRFREMKSRDGSRMLGLINPIYNANDCSNAECHVHPADQRVLGFLDVSISLRRLQQSTAEARLFSFIIFGILAVLAAAVFARIIHTHIQRPITELIRGTRQVADLNLDTTINIESPEEMHRLAMSFNKMTRKLKRAQKELQEWSESLEDRVKDKTKELKEAQDQLISAEKLASMGKLSAIVAHEINNPLSGILTYSKLLIRNLENHVTNEVIRESLKNLEIIRDESKRCGDIVQNLLLFSKKPIGRSCQCDVKSLLNKSIDLVQHSIEMKDVRLVREFVPEQITIFCDPSALEQMTVALLINAIEACPEKYGELFIRVKEIHDEQKIQIELEDNGTGIAREALPHIFEPFFSTKSGQKSVGLGLAVVYGIVERHGGTINVSSEEGRGTTFIIQFPVNMNAPYNVHMN